MSDVTALPLSPSHSAAMAVLVCTHLFPSQYAPIELLARLRAKRRGELVGELADRGR